MITALDGVKVLDFTRFMAGPTCTLILRDLGAEVIKVERPGRGDPIREFLPTTEGGESNFFINLNRGKKSITLNLASERGFQIIKDLAKKVDILVENFSPGVMDRLGLSYEAVNEINPGLIYASLSGFGNNGPRRSGIAFDIIGQAMGGLISVNGFPNSPPVKVGTSIGDSLCGTHGVIAILAALHYRGKTGEGQRIDISMQDCIWSITAIEHAGFYFLNNEIPQKPANSYPNDAGTNIYATKDSSVIIAAITTEQFESLLKAISRKDLIGNPKYTTQTERIKHKDEFDAIVESWTKTKTVEEITNELTQVRVPCSQVPDFDQVANDPQLLYREMIIEVNQPLSGKVKVPGSLFKMSKTPGNIRFHAPSLGEHNYEVYSELLGYSKQDIKKLEEDGIIK